MERNHMALRDVRGDTRFALERSEKVMIGRNRTHRVEVTVAQVIALKKCGCNGPNLGQVQTIPAESWPEELPEGQPAPRSKLWAAYPRGVGVAPVAYAWQMDAAARQLRSWWATRNIKAVLQKRAPTSGLSQAHH